MSNVTSNSYQVRRVAQSSSHSLPASPDFSPGKVELERGPQGYTLIQGGDRFKLTSSRFNGGATSNAERQYLQGQIATTERSAYVSVVLDAMTGALRSFELNNRNYVTRGGAIMGVERGFQAAFVVAKDQF